MDFIQSASTAAGQQQPDIVNSPEVAQRKTIPGNSHGDAAGASTLHTKLMEPEGLASFERTLKGPLPPGSRKIQAIISYAESHSTASSSSVNSSGQSSPSSTSTATSNFQDFRFEDMEEVAIDDEDATDLRVFGSPFHQETRGGPPFLRGFSLDIRKSSYLRSSSVSDTAPMPKHLHGLTEISTRRPSYTFPLRSAAGWSTPDSPSYPASAPVSAPESRRGSTQTSSRPKSRLSTTQPLYGNYMYGVGSSTEPGRTSGDASGDAPMDVDGEAKEELLSAVNSGQCSRSPESDAIFDCASESATPPRQRPGQQQTEDICEYVLKQAFNVDLQDLDFATDALESVAHCLEELSHLVYGCRPLQFTLPIAQVPTGDCTSAASREYGLDQPARRTRGKKRRNTHDDQNGVDPDDDQEDNQSGGEGVAPFKSKKIRVEPPDNRYPCPYRKRNPLRFNVRDFTTCATTYFSDFTNLKRHVKLYHRGQPKLPFVCYRCGIDQGTRDQLMTHIQQPPERICAVRFEAQNSDPEEGITQEIEDLLNERRSDTRINTWPNLWRTLFPFDDDTPDSEFVPPVEWNEVHNEFEVKRDDLRSRIRLESETIKDLSPEVQVYFADRMDRICWDYIDYVLYSSRLHADYNQQKHHRRRRSPRINAVIDTAPGHGLHPPMIQRTILPKLIPTISEDGLSSLSNIVGVGISNGSSLSSSWETATSNPSTSMLHPSSSSTSLNTPGGSEPVVNHTQPSTYLPLSEIPVTHLSYAGFVEGKDLEKGKAVCRDHPADLVHYNATVSDEFPSFMDTLEGGDLTLFELFGDETNLNGYGYDNNCAQFNIGDPPS